MSVNILNKRLPSEYQEVEYIESTGTQYIDTQYVPNQDTSIFAKITLPIPSTNNTAYHICGARVSSNEDLYQIGVYRSVRDTIHEIKYGSNQNSSFATNSENIIIDKNKNKNKVYDFFNNLIFEDAQTYETFNCRVSLTIFATHNYEQTQVSTGIGGNKKVYSFIIYNDDTLVRNFIPCYRKVDNVIGLYDLVNDIFYTNAGTGTFLKGNNVGYEIQKVKPYILTRNPEYKLPDEVTSLYEQVEYLESTGEQYIDTGCVLGSSSNKFEIDLKLNTITPTKNSMLFGSNTLGTGNPKITNYFQVFLNTQGKILANIGSTGGQSLDVYVEQASTTRGKISLANNETSYEVTAYGTSRTGVVDGYVSDLNLYLFSRNSGGVSSNYTTMCLYESLIEIDGQVSRNFIPCYRKQDNKPGLLDIINNVFYTNANQSASQDFIVGNTVAKYIPQKVSVNILTPRLPSEYQEVEYIESTGEQWIDTGVFPANNTSVSVKIRKQETATSTKRLLGTFTNTTNRFGYLSSSQNKLVFHYGNIDSSHLLELSENTDYEIKNEKNVLYVDNQLIYTATQNTFVALYTLYLFALNNENTVAGQIKARLYYCRLWGNNILVRNFIPCYRKADNKPGLYDLVNGVFYTNANTQASQDFIVGQNVYNYNIVKI